MRTPFQQIVSFYLHRKRFDIDFEKQVGALCVNFLQSFQKAFAFYFKLHISVFYRKTVQIKL